VVPYLLFAVAAVVLVIPLVLGWREALRAGRLPQPIARRNWVFCALLVLIIAAAPLAPLVVVCGMERYAHVPFVPWVLPLNR
jgi:hypothetical protein